MSKDKKILILTDYSTVYVCKSTYQAITFLQNYNNI